MILTPKTVASYATKNLFFSVYSNVSVLISKDLITEIKSPISFEKDDTGIYVCHDENGFDLAPRSSFHIYSSQLVKALMGTMQIKLKHRYYVEKVSEGRYMVVREAPTKSFEKRNTLKSK